MRSGHLRATVAALMLLAGACSSDDDPESESGGGTVGGTSAQPDGSTPAGATAEAILLTSPDGRLTFEVPAGAVSTDVELGIDIVEPDSVPWLEGTRLVGPVYRLRPEGLVFPVPLSLVHELPEEEVRTDAGLSLATTLIGDDELVSIPLEQRGSAGRSGTYVHISQIERFGVVALIDGGVRLALEPGQIAVAEDEPIEMLATASIERDGDGPWPAYDLEQRWLVGAPLSGGSGEIESVVGYGESDTTAPWVVARTVSCDVAGDGDVTVEVSARVTGTPEPRSTTVIALDSAITCGDVGR